MTCFILYDLIEQLEKYETKLYKVYRQLIKVDLLFDY